MRVLHIVSAMGPGGIENLVFSLLRADEKNIFVLAINGTLEQTLKAWPALTSYKDQLIFANKKEGLSFEIVRTIKKACHDHSIDIIHSHHIGPLIYGSLASWGVRSPKHVHTQHDIWHLEQRREWWIEYLILNMRKDISLIAVSKKIFNYMKKLFPRNTINLVHNGIDTDRFKPGNKNEAKELLHLPMDSTIIANASRLEEIKGLHYLIQAMQFLPESYHVAVAGNGSQLETLKKNAASLGLSNRIHFLGHIDAIELLYQASDLFCLPSLEEGLPLAILEAQACNLPVICSDVGSCAEGVDPESGFLIAPKDPKLIAQTCKKAIKTGSSSRDFILAHFSLSSLIEKYQHIYTRCAQP
ncbi:MAG: glycosyltransferase [Legionella sp.]|jgi:glycosyltransferase involved in cell wall biosynthesis